MFIFKLTPRPIKFDWTSFRYFPRGVKPPEVLLNDVFPQTVSKNLPPKFSPLNNFDKNETRQRTWDNYDDYSELDEDEIKFEKSIEPPPDYGFEESGENNPKEKRKRQRLNYLRKQEIPIEDETLLTWSAMDQIREMYRSEPSLWTPEKIADSFPISIEGAKRFLGSRKPSNFTPETIRKHDEAVEKRWKAIRKGIPGVVSEKTLFMIEQGFIKYLPMRSFSNKKCDEILIEEAKIELKLEDSDEIESWDGPFTKLFKRHLKWKKLAKTDENNQKLLENDQKMNVSREELVKSVVFSKENDKNFDKNNAMMFEDFQKLWKDRVNSSRNRIDRKHNEWTKSKKYTIK